MLNQNKNKITAIQEEIKQAIRTKLYLKNEVQELKESILSLPPEEFFPACLLLNPQQWGFLVEQYLQDMHEWRKLDAACDIGDFMDVWGDNLELKVSFITGKKSKKINVRQVRMWQELDYYYIFAIVFDNHIVDQYLIYQVPADDFKDIVKKYGSPSHGTVRANQVNTNIEYSLTFQYPPNGLLGRTMEKYRMK